MELFSTCWAITFLWSYQSTVLITFKLNNCSEYFRAMIRIWIMFTCLQPWLPNPTSLGRKRFLHCKIRRNLFQKISGHIKEVILAPIKWTLSVLQDSSFLSLFVQLTKHYLHNNLVHVIYPLPITYFWICVLTNGRLVAILSLPFLKQSTSQIFHEVHKLTDNPSHGEWV